MGEADLVLRIVVAAGAGMLLGFEREIGGHAAGVRTHLLVAVGASLFTVAGAYGFADSQTMDPSRVAAQVASGIGFLGAGTILRSGANVRGLTTAATLWISGALGVASGAGLYLPLAVCLGTVLVALLGLGALYPLIRRVSPANVELNLVYEQGSGLLGPVMRGLSDLDGRVDDLTVDDDGGAGLRHVRIRVRVRDLTGVREFVALLRHRAEVRTVGIR